MKLAWRVVIPVWAFGALVAATQAQTTIVNYTFENTTTPIVGASISSLTWDSGASPSYAATFSSQGQALSLGGMANGNSFQVTLNAIGYQNVVFNGFRINGTSAAPILWNLSYSLTGPGGSFTSVSNFTMGTSAAVGSTTVPSFSFPSSANNNSSIVVSFMATTSTKIGGGTPANGTIHLDNVSFSGSASAIPEPSTYAAFLGAAVFVGVIWRRRRQRQTA